MSNRVGSVTSPKPPQSWNDRRREQRRIHPKYKDHWPLFVKKCEKRLRDGHREYGDGSFDRPLFSLLDEVEEEILDTADWSFIAWTRLDSLRERVRLLEDKLDEVEMKELIEKTVGDSREILDALEEGDRE